MASPDSGGGGGGGALGVVGLVVGSMHLGALGRRLLGGSTVPQASRGVRRELLTIPNVVKIAPGKYRLPAIPGVSPATLTNARRDLNRFVINWRAYSAGISTKPPDVGGDFSPITPGTPGPAGSGQPYTRPYPGYGTSAPPKSPPKAPTGTPADRMPPPRGMPAKYGTLWAVLIQVAIQYGWPYLSKKLGESWDAYFKRWMDREAKLKGLPKRRTPGGPGQRPTIPPINRPGTPGGPPLNSAPPPAPVIVIYNPPAPAPRPAPPRAPKPSDGLSVPKIYRRPLPVPVVPPTPTPLWQQFALAVAPSALGPLSRLLRVGPGSKRRGLTDPLTPGQGTTSNYFTSTSSAPFYASPPTSGKTCKCGPKKKRGPRKKRMICYKGSYTERASGINKRKRERVPCQA